MIQETKVKRRAQRIVRRLLTALLASCLTAGLIGCALMNVLPGRGKTIVIDPNTQVIRLAARTNYVAPCNGYFVPDAAMLRILDRLSEKDVFGPDSTK